MEALQGSAAPATMLPRLGRMLMQPHKLLGFGRPPAPVSGEDLPTDVAIHVDHDLYAVQRPNECGPCVGSMIIGHVTSAHVTPSMLERSRLIRGLRGTVPMDLEHQLHSYGVALRSYDASALSASQQERFLREQLARKRIVMMITEMHKRLHYIALLGYERDTFLAYDPMCVNDEEAGVTRNIDRARTGNCAIHNHKVIDDWRKACLHRLLPLYRGYAAVVMR